MIRRFGIATNGKWFFLLSGLITVAGLLVFLTRGFHLGPDFEAGSRIQLSGAVSTKQVVQDFHRDSVAVARNEITYGGSGGTKITIVRLPEVLNMHEESLIRGEWPKSQIDTVDPFAAKVTAHKAEIAIVFASLFILAYVALRFEYRFAVAGIVALFHDVFIVMSVFALLRIEVNLLFVTAILTIVGYSINDTIVIFDRIRENLKRSRPKTVRELEELVDKSLWQTMRRSINTVTTVLIASGMLYLFGGPTIHHFTLALCVGLVSGAYSSIFIASPLWLAWRKRRWTAM